MTEAYADGAHERALAELEREFSAMFARARRLYLDRAARLDPGLSPGAYKMFTIIVAHDGIRPSALSYELDADRSQVSRTLRELEERGLIARTSDPEDGRSSLIVPTDLGRQRLEHARVEDRRQMHATLAEWAVDDIRNLSHLLRALGEGVASRRYPPTADA